MKSLFKALQNHLCPLLRILFHFLIKFTAYTKKSPTFFYCQTVGNTYRHKAQGTFAKYLPLSYLPKPPWCRLSTIYYIVHRSSYSLLFQHPCYIHRLINYHTQLQRTAFGNTEAKYSLLFSCYYQMLDLTFILLL